MGVAKSGHVPSFSRSMNILIRLSITVLHKVLSEKCED